MRWDALFDDLQSQFDAHGAADLADEVADRTRRERALVQLADRLVARIGQSVTVTVSGGVTLEGVVTDVAQQWFVLQGPVLVSTSSVTGVLNLGAFAATAGRAGLGRSISLGSALRAVARDRSPVRIGLVDSVVLTGTLDAVGADHVDLAEHPADELRRPAMVRGVRTVPLAALAWVRPAPATSTLENG